MSEIVTDAVCASFTEDDRSETARRRLARAAASR